MDNKHYQDSLEDEEWFSQYLTGKNLLYCAAALSLLPAVLGFLSWVL